jgi:hypothetical protein
LANPTNRSSLPDAELNPLLNPLLAKNMGRWAEVYFNAVPEKREEAVQGLLRELEAEETGMDSNVSPETGRGALGGDTFGRTSSVSKSSFSKPAVSNAADRPAQDGEPAATLVCASCGHRNPADQRFCGMCGAGLRAEAAVAEPFQSTSDEQREFIPRDLPLRDDYARDDSSERNDYSQRTSDYPYSYRREYYGDDRNLDHMFELTSSHSGSYRIVIAGAVAIIAVVLVYAAWRTGQMTSALMRLEGKSPTASQQQPAQPQNPAPQTANGAQSGAANNSVGNAPTEQPQASSPAQQESHPSTAKAGKREVTIPAKPAATETASAPAIDNGAQELAIGQGYLNGGSGHQTDRSEAAQWLWKAVGKRNLEATLLLSDLYLHGGPGFAKNCDQARILLDAAAVRGSAEAGVRLRNMQAFGCQ